MNSIRAFGTRHKRTLLVLLFLGAFSVTVVHAIPPSTKYNPGDTLDPNCAPGDANCSVLIFPDQTGNAGKFLTTDGSSVSWASVVAGGAWGSITGTLSNQTDLQNALNAKQDTLVSGTNIKTINGTSVLGSGDITVADSTTASNGLTMSGSDVQLGGTLSTATTINQGGNTLEFNNGGFDRAVLSGGSLDLLTNSGNDAVKAVAYGGYGLAGNFELQNDGNTFSNPVSVAIFSRRKTTVSASAGDIANIGFSLYSNAFGAAGVGQIEWLYDSVDNTNSTYVGEVRLKAGTSSGSSYIGINGNGNVQFDKYGSGTFTGTAAYNLGVDASGNIIEVPAGSSPWTTVSGGISYTGGGFAKIGEGTNLIIGDGSATPTTSAIQIGDPYSFLYEKYDDEVAISAGGTPNTNRDVFRVGWDSSYNHVIAQLGDIQHQDHGNYINIDDAGVAVKNFDGVSTTTTWLNVDSEGLSLGNAYLTFSGSQSNVNGYGFRDNAGTIEYKNSGGSWAPIAGGSSLALQTNGTANGSQSLLNLAAGTNVTLTDNGTGTITIAASGGGTSQWDNVTGGINYAGGNVGVGTTTPLQKLDITGGSMRLDNTTGASPAGIIYKGTTPFISDFNYGNNGTVTTAGNNTFVGVGAGNLSMGSTATLAGDASYNTVIGAGALSANTTGSKNTANGYQALYSNTTGDNNTANGYQALYSNDTGLNNTANGYQALYSNTGSNNTATGKFSLWFNTTGSYNTADGYSSLNNNTTGRSNASFGEDSLYNNTTGSYNTADGYQSLYDLNITANDGSGNNTAIGYNAGRGIVTGINNTIIGANVTGLASGLSNNVIIADGSGNQRINIDNTGAFKLGTYGIGTHTGTAAYNLAVDASGNVIEVAAGGGGSYTASNGLTMSGSDVQLGGTLTGNTTISGSGNQLEVSGNSVFNGNHVLYIYDPFGAGTSLTIQTGTSSTAEAIYGGNAGGAGTAAYFQTGSGTALVADGGSTGLGIDARSYGNYAISAFRGATANNQNVSALKIYSNYGSGATAAGSGVNIEFDDSTTNFTVSRNLGNLNYIWTDATDATRTSQFSITGVNNAVTNTLFTLSGSGAAKFNQYGSGTFTGTAAYNLAVDSSGNVIEVATSGGSGPTLQTNGTNNGSQSTLNLVAGTNVTLTDNGNGSVTIDAASGGSSPISIANGTTLYSSGLTGTGIGSASIGENIFLGDNAGSGATSVNKGNFFGLYAGSGAINAGGSNFFGAYAGQNASSSDNANFFGQYAGDGATTANGSNFFGLYSGQNASSANYSNFFGISAGQNATSAYRSEFFGFQSGDGAANASYSFFLGDRAGSGATYAANSFFFGRDAGYSDTVNNTSNGLSSILIGNFTRTGGFSNSILLGSGTSGSPISNTKANQFMLAPTITEARFRGVDYTFPSAQAAASGYVLTNDGTGVLSWAAPSGGGGSITLQTNGTANGSQSLLNLAAGTGVTLTDGGTGTVTIAASGGGSSPISIGTSGNTLYSSGLSSTGQGDTVTGNNIILGDGAGDGASSASNSNFLGYTAGFGATSAIDSNFLGNSAGASASGAHDSNFFGYYAGNSAINASNSTFIGVDSGQNATNASNSTFIGYLSGKNATNAQNSIFIGKQAGFNDSIVDNTTNGLSSILIGSYTNTGGFSNSILLGSGTSSTPIANTKANQFMLAPSITEARFRGIDYTFPAAQAAGSGYVLTNDGSGGLSWAAGGGGSSYTSSNGLTLSGSDFQLGGTLTQTTNIDTAGHIIAMTNTTGTFPSMMSLTNTVADAAGTGVFTVKLGQSGTTNISGQAIAATSYNLNATTIQSENYGDNSYGVSSTANTTTGGFAGYFVGQGAANALYAWSNATTGALVYTSASTTTGTATALQASVGSSSTNIVETAIRALKTSSAAANGIGVSIDMGASTPVNQNPILISNRLISKWTTATNASRTSEFSITGVNSGTTSTLFRIEGDGKTGIDTTAAPAYVLDVGNSSVTGIVASFTNSTGSCTINPTASSVGCSSDERLKKNIVSLNAATAASDGDITTNPDAILHDILALRPVTYNWKTESDTTAKHTGFIAQEVQQIFPDLVSQDANGYYTVNYMGFAPYTVAAIQQLDIHIQDIENLTPGTDDHPSFVDKLVAWLGDAGNGIKQLFAKEVDTENLCVTDASGKTCVTRSQLDQLLAGSHAGTTTVVTSTSTTVTNSDTQTPDATPETVTTVTSDSSNTTTSSSEIQSPSTDSETVAAGATNTSDTGDSGNTTDASTNAGATDSGNTGQ